MRPLINRFRNPRRIVILIAIIIFVFSFLLFVASSYNREKIRRSELDIKHLTVPPTASFEPDQLVVRFNNRYDPDRLIEQIEERKKNKARILQDLSYQLHGESLPEEKMNIIKKTLFSLGVVRYKKLFNGSDPLLIGFYYLELHKNSDIIKVQQQISESPIFLSSEPNFKWQLFAVPNDPAYSQLWGMEKIQAPQAWDITKGSTAITVAVIDSGAALSHPDLSQNIVPGYDFANGDSDPSDDVGHGTHVAGTIGAVGNNNLGVVGVNWNVKIMPLKVCRPAGRSASCDTRPTTDAVTYAVDNGAKVINMSLGGPTPCFAGTSYYNVIQYALSKGVVIVVAAGNDGQNASGYSPASCPGVIVVGATDSSDRRSIWSANQSSNYGNIVLLAAPGTNIYSTWPGGSYKMDSGTSMASPHVAGAAALLLSANPSLTPAQVKNCLIQNGDPITTDRPIGVRLNVFKALQACSSGNPPSPSTSPTVSPSPTSSPLQSNKIIVTVFNDTNNNLKQDAGESGIQGANITLSGALSQSVNTDAKGEVTFQNAPAGSYTLVAKISGQTIGQGPFSIPNDAITTVHFSVPVSPQFLANPTPIIITPIVVTSTPTPTPTSVGGFEPNGTPVPTPDQYFSCKPDPNCVKGGKSIQLCPLVCTPQP